MLRIKIPNRTTSTLKKVCGTKEDQNSGTQISPKTKKIMAHLLISLLFVSETSWTIGLSWNSI